MPHCEIVLHAQLSLFCNLVTVNTIPMDSLPEQGNHLMHGRICMDPMTTDKYVSSLNQNPPMRELQLVAVKSATNLLGPLTYIPPSIIRHPITTMQDVSLRIVRLLRLSLHH